MTVLGLDHVVLNVRDAERAMCWYRDRLGLQPERYEEWKLGEAPFLSLRITQRVVIDLLETGRSGENVDHIALEWKGPWAPVLDCDDVEVLRVLNNVWGARGWGVAVYIRDLDGNQIELKKYGRGPNELEAYQNELEAYVT